MTDEGEQPGRAPARRRGPLDPSPLIEDSELPRPPSGRRRTAIAEPSDEPTSEGSDATDLEVMESFSTFSTDGGTDGAMSLATQSEGLETAGATMSSTNLVLGALVRDYLLEEKLGDGTFAEVFRARHVPTGRVLALKVLRQALAFDETLRRRVLREGELLRGLRHRNLVEVYEVGLLEDGRAFVAMEILSGRTLRDLLSTEAPLSPDRAFRLTEQIASGLEVAHRAGIVHRDLKPANIFVLGQAPAETVKLLDFGLARIVDRGEFTQLTRAGDLIGSPGFMAPEQIRDPARADPRADLYALGVTAYAMVMGRLPFVGRTHDVLKAQLSSTPAPLPALGGFERVVHALMSKDPEDRPASASSLLEQLHGVAEPTLVPSTTWPRMVSATPASTPVSGAENRAPRGARDHSTLLTAILLAVAALLIVGLFQLRGDRRRARPEETVSQGLAPPPRASPSPSPSPPPSTVPPAPTAEAVQTQEPDPEPRAPSRRSPRSSRTKDPSDRRPELSRVKPELSRALRSRGLRLADAASLLPNEPALQSSSLPPEELDALLDAVARAEITDSLLRTRLKRLLDALERLAKSEPPPASLSMLEARYFRAREALASAKGNRAALERLNGQIDELETELERASR